MVALLTPAAAAISSRGVASPRPWNAAMAAARIWATLRAASASSPAALLAAGIATSRIT